MRFLQDFDRPNIIGGLTTFLTVSYIIFVNPSILSTPGTGMSFSGVMTATVVLCFFCTLLMGVYAKLPFAVAPGMGINAFFTFQLILAQQIPWQTALGIVFWAGVIFLVISTTALREKIADAIPLHLRNATACGIGLFLTFIGLKNSGLIVADPATFVSQGPMKSEFLMCVAGFVLLLILFRRKSPFAFLSSIVVITVASLLLGKTTWPEQVVSAPDFSSTFFQLDLWGALKWVYVPAILTFVFIDLFDSLSTFVGVSFATGLVDEKGKPKNVKQGLVVDAVATFGAGLVGTSSGTAFIESAAGIEAGGRKGSASVVTALCFLPCLFIAPLAGMVPAFATAPVLIFVGILMFKNISQITWNVFEDLVPAFLTLTLIPLTFSITHGITWGILSHIGLYWMAGRRKELSPVLYLIGLFCLLLLIIEMRH